MFFDKKEEEKKLPDLPPLKNFMSGPRLEFPHEDYDNEKHSLPSFPNSPAHNKFSQDAIKGAVEDDDDGGLTEIPGDDKSKVIEMEEWEPSGSLHSQVPEHSEIVGIDSKLRSKDFSLEPVGRREQKSADVFVKIDKFYSAKKTLVEVKERLEEIDELVKKIRATKLKEEQELNAWEKDIAHIKSRIQTVNENIFEKVE